ncbi:MAG: peroxiredoxin [Kiritimatiellia bacterium]|nr:peroxiredoxin [Kiritimatiellia bacterium]
MKRWSSILLLTPWLALSARALSPGDAAPDFSAASTANATVSLSGLKGKWVVLFFYPKSFTPGCTKQSCSLRDGYKDLLGKKAVVLGVSLDRLETQKKFKEEHKLPFDLLSDEDKAMATAYRVLGMGGLFARRVTFIIGPDGKIASILDRVNVDRHAQDVADELTRLQAR